MRYYNFICWNGKNYFSNFSINSSGFEKPAELRLRQLLNELRISATIHQIPEWSRNEEFIRHSSAMKHFADNRENDASFMSDENINRSKLYMRR